MTIESSTSTTTSNYELEMDKLQKIITDVTPEQLYNFIMLGSKIPDYRNNYEELVNSYEKLNKLFKQYKISYKYYQDEYEDETSWSGYLIYKFTINSSEMYIKSVYYHNSYDDDAYYYDHNTFKAPLELVKKTEKEVIKYEEDEIKILKNRIRNNLETFLKDKNIICIISSESLLWKWENEGCKILQWPELKITNHKIRNEIKNWKVFIYTKETKDECFGVRPLSDTHECVLIPSKYENLTNMAIDSSFELP